MPRVNAALIKHVSVVFMTFVWTPSSEDKILVSAFYVGPNGQDETLLAREQLEAWVVSLPGKAMTAMLEEGDQHRTHQHTYFYESSLDNILIVPIWPK
jgi:hypothetical protein